MKTTTKLIILLFTVALVYSCGQKHSKFSDAEAERMRTRFDSCIAFNNSHRLETPHIIDTMLSIYEEVENTPAEVLTEKRQKMQRQIFLAKSNLYLYKGNVDSMLITLKEGLRNAEAGHDTTALTNAYIRMVALYTSWRMEKQAKMFIHKALDVVDNTDDAHKLQYLLTLGMAYNEQHKTDSALILLNRADKVIAQNDTILKTPAMGLDFLYSYIKGWVCSTIPDSAASVVRLLEPTYKAYAPLAYKITGIDVISHSLGQAYSNLGDKAKAQQLFDQSMDIVIKTQTKDNYDVAKRLMEQYIKENDKARILKLLPVWYKLETELYNNMSSSMLTEYEVEYRVAEHKHMIEKQKLELKMRRLQNMILICVVVILLLVCAWGVWFWQVRKKKMRNLFEAIMFRYNEWHNMMLEVRNGGTPVLRVNAISPNILLGAQKDDLADEITDEETQDNDNKTAQKQQESNDSSFNKYHNLYCRVLAVMETEKPFINPRLTIDNLARIVGTNRTGLSFCINSMSHCNFNQWVAIYRVNYLLELYMADRSQPLEDFITEAGFASRSSFYRQFKVVTGLTPTQFKHQLNLK